MKVEIAPLEAAELDEAWRICNLAFGTFLGAPDPSKTFGDRDLMRPRFGSGCAELLAARAGGRLIGSVIATRWGSFGFFGPLTVLPEYWDQGIAKSLLEETVRVFERWGVRHSGLFTFPNSAKHIWLYQKFGYWPQYLTAIMRKTPQPGGDCELYSGSKAVEHAARELTDAISPGLDLTAEYDLHRARFFFRMPSPCVTPVRDRKAARASATSNSERPVQAKLSKTCWLPVKPSPPVAAQSSKPA